MLALSALPLAWTLALFALAAPNPWPRIGAGLVVSLPVVIACWYLSHCGARSQKGTPCRRRRNGLARRCHQHHAPLAVACGPLETTLVTAYDLWGLLFIICAGLGAWFAFAQLWNAAPAN